MKDKKLEMDFDEEMHRDYQRAYTESHYKATRFLHMLHEHRGLQTALMLIHSSTVSERYKALGNVSVWIWLSRQSSMTIRSGTRCSRRRIWPSVQSG